MKYNQINATSPKSKKRVGRGISAGQGKTAGRGTKGQKSRSGSSRKPGFEGGQNPLIQRLPKLRGFTSHRKKTDFVTVAQLNALKSASIDNATLVEAGLIDNRFTKVKLVGNSELKRKVTVKLQGASVGAIKAVENAGGSVTIIAQEMRQSKDKGAAK